MCLLHLPRFGLLACAIALGLPAASANAASPKAAESEQLRIIGVMSEQLRARIDRLPVLLEPERAVGDVKEVTVTLNRNPVVVEGQRFDGLVVTAPPTAATFAWAFVSPANAASWYIFREKGDMKGFSNFLRQPRGKFPAAAAMQPTNGDTVALQALASTHWTPGERYIVWFSFKDEVPAELTIRAGFFARSSLSNHHLAALLFPAEVPSAAKTP
ncbi:MAG TPA: hypothetical protein VHF69_01805 [Candidatus Synoicihabitans sp.]|nr:hypothetical protein [Candidatus Synoicihabitans sp.]